MIKGTVKIATELCKGCELCISACPQDCLALTNNINLKGYKFIQLKNDACTGCTNCALVCPDAVFTVFRQSKSSMKKAV
ncbi:MAG: 4Fe-4S dicluster domain-containing protein [Ignavibacteriaceae bacterium]|nr:4Fe-4S dicluster domain-containing protein [Ignavibacteriaceae bacterium]